MRVIYVAGPFRGPSHWAIAENIRHAERLALLVWQSGGAAICPHLNTAHFQDAAPDDVWLKGDLAILSRCDAVIFTNNWRKSVGACAEHQHAIDHDIPTFYDIDTLATWIQEDVHGVSA